MTLDRSLYIGSSDIASILGVSPWRTAYEVWESKQPGFVRYEDPDKAKILRRGVRFEPVILDMLQEETGIWITGRNVRHADSEHPFLQCEIDAESTDEETSEVSNIEIKSSSPFAAKDFGESGTDEIPIYYGAQVMFSLMVTGRQKTIVAALIGSDDLRVYEVKRDEELIAHIRKASMDFWFNNVANRVPPPIQTSEDAAKMLSKFQGFAVEADEVAQRELRIIKGIKAAEKLLEAKRETLELSIKTALVQAAVNKGIEGDPDKFALVGANGKPLVTWHNQTTNRLSQKRVKDEFPSVYEQCVEPSTFRVLRLK